MGSLLVVTGPPGAGKSTVARILANRLEPSVLVEGDAFFGFLARGALSPWLPGSEHQNEIVTLAAASAAGSYTSGGFETVYDGVVGPWSLPAFAFGTGLTRLDYVLLLPPAEQCVERVLTRPAHGFADEAATRKMHDEFRLAQIDERHRLTHPPDRAVQVADDIVAARQQGTFTYVPSA